MAEHEFVAELTRHESADSEIWKPRSLDGGIVLKQAKDVHRSR
jgi:hypothetical protein